MSHIISIIHEKIKCPLCEKSEIEITTKPEYYSYTTARAFGKIKQIPVYHPEQIKIESNCPNCKARKTEIKEALEKGISKETHEDRLKRLKDAGLPLVLKSGKE